MENYNSLIGNYENDNSRYCFAKTGEVYVVYLPEGGTTNLDLSGVPGNFSVSWYDPRSGGDLQKGSVATVQGGRIVPLGTPPSYEQEDWAVLVRRQ